MLEPCRTWGGAGVKLVSGVMACSAKGRERGGRKGRDPLGGSRRGERQRAQQNALGELDLEPVVAGRRGIGERRRRRPAEGVVARGGPCQELLRRAGSPRLGGAAPQGEPRL